MPNDFTLTQVPASRVPIVDANTGFISREWYRFFYNLYTLTGGGGSNVTIPDILLGPAESSLQSSLGPIYNDLQGIVSSPNYQSLISELDNVIARINALEAAPIYTPQLIIPAYGSFYDTTSQTAALSNTAYAITFNTSDISNNVYIGTPTSRVYVNRLGTYNIQFSLQLLSTAGGTKNVYIWADINGSSIPNSATVVTLSGGANSAVVAAWNFVYTMNAGDYFRLMWSTDNTNMEIHAAAASAPVPAIPSVILTVTDNIGVK